MVSNNVALGASIVKGVVERDLAEGATIEDKARSCFEASWEESNAWFVHTDDERFMIGCGGLAMLCNDEERLRIRAELDTLRGLNAACSGIPVDLNVLAENMGEPIGLQKLFFEAKPEG